MVDHVMMLSHSYVKMLVCDGEGCNQSIRAAIHGDMEARLRRKLLDTKFFSDIKHRKVPGMECLPRFPIACAFYEESALFAMPGPAHAVKNCAGQICAEGKLVFFGVHFCDAAGTIGNGMPLPAFSRRDPMSDRLTSLLSNPLFLLSDEAPWLKSKLWVSVSKVVKVCQRLSKYFRRFQNELNSNK